MMENYWQHFKHVLSMLVADHVNIVNFGVTLGIVWAQIIAVIGVSATNIANNIHVGLGLIAVGFLCAYNGLKFYRLWKTEENDSKRDKAN